MNITLHLSPDAALTLLATTVLLVLALLALAWRMTDWMRELHDTFTPGEIECIPQTVQTGYWPSQFGKLDLGNGKVLEIGQCYDYHGPAGTHRYRLIGFSTPAGTLRDWSTVILALYSSVEDPQDDLVFARDVNDFANRMTPAQGLNWEETSV